MRARNHFRVQRITAILFGQCVSALDCKPFPHKDTRVAVLLAPVCFDPTQAGVKHNVLCHRFMGIEAQFTIALAQRFRIRECEQGPADAPSLMLRVHRDIVQQHIVRVRHEHEKTSQTRSLT